ncbi:DNA repair protein [Xanthomonas arboricola]|uniref:DNA repair protein n=1 Tax=Xanthomonas arboricola TaxID=56448 RepID=UPI0015E398EC|nr:DNA repair protein [Xanthomonas arboricola]
MQPHWLRLKGFRGIRDGLGGDELILDLDRLAEDAALVALAGANGRGKTTILDNLHPYLTMPSRATSAAGFSYYDHVHLPESEKELVWSLSGRRYRSHVVIRNNGRRRTEAFLFAWEQDRWSPVALDDGTVSDGKVDSYARCVEALCGSAETFFTSVFSAQGQRPLSQYRNGEIKSLLGELLGQEEIVRWGQRAAETARLLKTGLAVLRQERESIEREAQRVADEQARVADAAVEATRYDQERDVASAALRTAQAELAASRAEREQAAHRLRQRDRLRDERTALIAHGRSELAALEAQDRREVERDQALRQRSAQRIAALQVRRQALQRQAAHSTGLIELTAAIRRAVARLPLAERVESLRQARVLDARAQVAQRKQVQQVLAANRQRQADIEQAAGQAVLKAEDLRRRFGLTNEVPCAGSDLQGRCRLLGDAHQAHALIPGAEGQVRRLGEQQQALRAEHGELAARLDALASAPEVLAWSEYRWEHSRDRARTLAQRAARHGELEQARAALSEAEQGLAALVPEEATAEEVDEGERIAAARAAIETRRQQVAAHHRRRLDELDRALQALPAWSPARLEQAEAAAALAQARTEAVERAHLAALKRVQAHAALSEQAEIIAGREGELRQRIARVEEALGTWILFARCMGADGVIALAIDDAGPVLAGLANDLLLACYGPRFTLSIHTQVETANGQAREGFEIVVHDADSGQSKPVALVSGGERVWINACLTRAVALYLACQSGRRYATLFSDEADGALDPERKRMWMRMKREVLRLGGYGREYYVSQTPELTALADAVIDLEGGGSADSGVLRLMEVSVGRALS